MSGAKSVGMTKAQAGIKHEVLLEAVNGNSSLCSHCEKKLNNGAIARTIVNKNKVPLAIYCSQSCLNESSHAGFLLGRKSEVVQI